MAKLYMGFDAGTQSVKVAVYDESFNPVASHSLPTTLHYPQPGWVQMNIDEFLNITVECMRKTVDTIKGKGVSFMENAVDWHGKGPNDEEYAVAMQELNAAYAALEQEEK